MPTMSWLPPYGWWSRTLEDRTTVFGWDWMTGAITFFHGFITLPLCAWLTRSYLVGGIAWLAGSLLIAAGVGWRVAVDPEGFVFSWCWFAIPLSRRRFSPGSPLEVADDGYAPEGADFGVTVSLGSGSQRCEFGTRYNASPIKGELDRAVQRHHRKGWTPAQRTTKS